MKKNEERNEIIKRKAKRTKKTFSSRSIRN